MRAYVSVLRARGVARNLAATTLSRLGVSSLSVALLLGVVQQRGSVAEAGAALAAFGTGLAVAAPFTARLTDRRPARGVLVCLVLLHGLALAGVLVVLEAGGVIWLLAGLCGFLGASAPPTAPVARGVWPSLIPSARLHTIYALDSTLNSAMFVAGPAVVGVLTFLVEPVIIVGAAGVVRLSGDLLLAMSPDLSRPDVVPALSRRLGVLGDPRARLLLIAISLDTFAYGALQVGAATFTQAGLTALLITLIAAGEVAGGLTLGARRWPGPERTQLLVLNAAAIPVLAALVPSTPILVVAMLYAVAGITSGARDALNQVVLSQSLTGSRATGFAWLATFMWAGYSVGTLVTGQLSALGGSAAVFTAASVALVIATVLVARLPRLDARAGTPSA